MPNCFSLTKKGENTPTPLNQIDRELCQLLGVEEHPRLYVANWFDTIGFNIAMGKPLHSEELKSTITKWCSSSPERLAEIMKVLDYLREHYTDDAWAEIGRNRD